MIIIVDTTETFGDLTLSGAHWKLVEEFLRRENALLVVPEVVVEETVNHFREKLEEATRDQAAASRTLSTLTGAQVETRIIDIADSIAQYRTRLKQRLKQLSAQSLPMAGVDVTTLVARALRHEPPFDREGQRGFRDAVLWESLLAFLKVNRTQAYFVTRNVRDFCEQNSGDTILNSCNGSTGEPGKQSPYNAARAVKRHPQFINKYGVPGIRNSEFNK